MPCLCGASPTDCELADDDDDDDVACQVSFTPAFTRDPRKLIEPKH